MRYFLILALEKLGLRVEEEEVILGDFTPFLGYFCTSKKRRGKKVVERKKEEERRETEKRGREGFKKIKVRELP